MSGHMDERPVVLRGEGISHKLPGTASCDISSEDLSEEGGKQICSTTGRKSDSRGICKQLGRGNLHPGKGTRRKPMDVEPRKKINTPGTVSPRVQNARAHRESRVMRDHSDCMVSPAIFKRILRRFPGLEIDLFASRLSSLQLPRFFSWRPDLLTEGTDAFVQEWERLQAYVNPLWSLIGGVLTKTKDQRADLVLIALVRPSQPLYPRLLNILIAFPLRIRQQSRAMLMVPLGEGTCQS